MPGSQVEVTRNCRVQLTGFEPGESPEEYDLVHVSEADIATNRIPNDSPLARTLIGQRIGDSVTFESPAGPVELTIVDCQKL